MRATYILRRKSENRKSCSNEEFEDSSYAVHQEKWRFKARSDQEACTKAKEFLTNNPPEVENPRPEIELARLVNFSYED